MRGPATLLYGSNAVGGVVNAVTPHESYRDSMIEGTRGQLSADGGSANNQAGTNASVQHARGNLMMWAGGGARRSDDYDPPEGTIENQSAYSRLAGYEDLNDAVRVLQRFGKLLSRKDWRSRREQN